MQKRLKEAARAVINNCLCVKPSDSVLVITDTKLQNIGQVFFEEAVEYGGEVSMVVITPRNSHAEEPPASLAELMKQYDVLIIPTYRSMSHTDARRYACELGARCATLPGILPETMMRTLVADYDRIAALSEKLAEHLTRAKKARVTTAAGTDIEFSLEGRMGYADTGLLRTPGRFSNLPAGEAYTAPFEGTANGVIVVDGTIGDTGVLSKDDRITITVKDGYATEITGGKAAQHLISLVEPHGKEALNIAELGIGTNHEAKLIGNILEDEKVLSTVHIALGDNKSMGGNIAVNSHLDGVLLCPMVYLDDEPIIKDGKITV